MNRMHPPSRGRGVRRVSTRRPKQDGAVALVLAIALPLLLGLAGLAIDVGRMLVLRAELQTVVDACALASVSALASGNADRAMLERAEAYGSVPANPDAVSLSGSARPRESVNRHDFQSDSLTRADLQVQFASSAQGPWFGASEASAAMAQSARYARCTAMPQRSELLLARFVGTWATMSASATAVASLVPAQIGCAFPLALCRGVGAGATATPPFGLGMGQWFKEPTSSGSNRYNGAGSFGWVDFSPPQGGADELAMSIEGRGACALSTGQPVGESGMKSSVYDSWNSRFGLYRSGGPTATQSPGDWSGVAYTSTTWPEQRSAYAGASSSMVANFLASRAAFMPYQGDQAAGLNVNYSQNWTVAQRQASGRDRRLVVVPIVDCTVWNENGSARPSIEAWGCGLLLSPIGTGSAKRGPGQIEYLGLANDPASPCTTSGLPGSPSSGGPRVPALVE